MTGFTFDKRKSGLQEATMATIANLCGARPSVISPLKSHPLIVVTQALTTRDLHDIWREFQGLLEYVLAWISVTFCAPILQYTDIRERKSLYS